MVIGKIRISIFYDPTILEFIKDMLQDKDVFSRTFFKDDDGSDETDGVVEGLIWCFAAKLSIPESIFVEALEAIS